MKVLMDAQDGYETLLGQSVLVFCANYIYAGKLTGVNDHVLLLSEPSIVYETGPFTEKGYKDAQRLPGDKLYLNLALVESVGAAK